MNNNKKLFTISLILVSVTTLTASNLFDVFCHVKRNDIKNGIAVPASRPSTNHLEKNTNAKYMAKQLSKSASANVILGKISNVLERYGYCTSLNGSTFSNSDFTTASSSPMESFEILSTSRNEKTNIIRIRVESNKDLQAYFNTESGLEIPFQLMNLGENEVFISSSYLLPNGNYIIKLRSKSGDKELKLVIDQRELLGKK